MEPIAELESPRKRMYHRITGTVVMTFGSLAVLFAMNFLLH